MVHLLTYLAGLPRHEFPLVFPTRACPPKFVIYFSYIPGWKGETRWWLLGMNASGRGSKSEM